MPHLQHKAPELMGLYIVVSSIVFLPFLRSPPGAPALVMRPELTSFNPMTVTACDDVHHFGYPAVAYKISAAETVAVCFPFITRHGFYPPGI